MPHRRKNLNTTLPILNYLEDDRIPQMESLALSSTVEEVNIEQRGMSALEEKIVVEVVGFI